MHTVNILKHLVENHLALAYVLIFLITIVEGEIVVISAGILVLLGALNFWLSLTVILFAGMVKTLAGYLLGRFLHKKFNSHRFFQYMQKRVLSVMPHFAEKPFWSIFFSKFLIGVNHSVIVFSGYQKVNFRTYFKAEFLSTIIWAPGFIALGYFFSYTALRITKRLSEFFLIIILCVIGFFLLDKLLTVFIDAFENLKNNHDNQN